MSTRIESLSQAHMQTKPDPQRGSVYKVTIRKESNFADVLKQKAKEMICYEQNQTK